MRSRRVLVALVLLLVLLALVEAWFLAAATGDPYGLDGAAPVTRADLPNVEALYGKAWTPLDGVLAWSPDGRHVAIGGGRIVVIDAYTGAVTAEWSTPGETTALAWSPDGQTLAAGVNTAGWVYDGWVILYDGQGVPQRSWYAVHQDLGGLAWSPTGDRIVAVGNTEFGVWTNAGLPLYHFVNASTTGLSASWSPDGTRFALGEIGGPLIIDAATGQPVNPPIQIGDWYEVAWSPTGDRIAAGGALGVLALFRPDGSLVLNATGFYGGVMGMPVAWSPDGTMIATLGPDGISIVSGSDLTTERSLIFPMQDFLPGRAAMPTYDQQVAWSPSGTALAATGSTSHPSFRLWGVRHERLGLPLIALGLTTALGLGLILRRDVLWLAMSPDRVGLLWTRTDPSLRTGTALFLFAVVSSVIESLGESALGRIYGLQTTPPSSWYAVTGLLSTPTVLIAAAAAAWAFHELVWPGGHPRPFESRGRAVFGYVLLPFLLALGVGNVLVGLIVLVLPTMGRDVAAPLLSGVLGGVLGLGFYYSGRLVRGFPWARARFPWVALAASAVISIITLFGMAFALFAGLNVFQVPPPTADIQTYGFSVLLDFGFVPLISVLIGLAATAAIAAVPSAMRFATAGYARVQGSATLELETRRKVLDLVVAEPGIHFRRLLQVSGLGSGTIHYHLSVLEREGYIQSRREGRLKRFFARLPEGHPPIPEIIKAI